MAVLFAAIRFGLWPSVYTALLSFVSYNFFFTEPHYTFLVERREDLLTVVLFLVVAVIVGNLAARLKAQVESMRQITRRTANLYDFSRKIAGAASLNDVLWAAVHHVASTLQCHSLVLLPRDDDRLEIASGYPPEDQMSPTAWGAAQWAWEHNQAAGWDSGTLPASEWLFLPSACARRCSRRSRTTCVRPWSPSSVRRPGWRAVMARFPMPTGRSSCRPFWRKASA
jgi:two-component system sensor histidine kinase KdpD